MTEADALLQSQYQKFEALGADYVRTKLEMGVYEGEELALAQAWLESQSAAAATEAPERPASGGRFKLFLMVLLLGAGCAYLAWDMGMIQLPKNLALPF